MSQFIRFYRPQECKDILVNVNSIWKIEVSYVVEGEKHYHPTTLESGIEDPNAERVYLVFFGSETFRLIGTAEDDPVMKVLEDIYKNAVKN